MTDRYTVINRDTLEAMRRAGHVAKLEARIEELEAQLAQSQLKRWAARWEEQADRIEKLEAALQAVIRYAGNAGDDYLADKSRKALEGKDD